MKLRTVVFWLLALPIFLADVYKRFINPEAPDYVSELTNAMPSVVKIILFIIYILALLYFFPYRRRR